jgi:hypothetical protein
MRQNSSHQTHREVNSKRRADLFPSRVDSRDPIEAAREAVRRIHEAISRKYDEADSVERKNVGRD